MLWNKSNRNLVENLWNIRKYKNYSLNKVMYLYLAPPTVLEGNYLLIAVENMDSCYLTLFIVMITWLTEAKTLQTTWDSKADKIAKTVRAAQLSELKAN